MMGSVGGSVPGEQGLAVNRGHEGSLVFRCGRFCLELGRRTLVMGVLNLTPDSFSGDGIHGDPGRAVERAHELVEAGADILDIGGESTRPGSAIVDADLELRRVVPVLERLGELSVPISVDTRRAAVAQAALTAGASILNDISGLGEGPQLASLVAGAGAGVVLMHMQGTPQDMQRDPHYEDVVGQVATFLAARARAAREAGIGPESIVLDPGIGFGKTLEHNLALLAHLDALAEVGYPVLVGTSRKSFIGQLTGQPVETRLSGSLASVAVAIARGADIVRVHDVRETRQAVAVADAIVRGAR